jgi:fructokinase
MRVWGIGEVLWDVFPEGERFGGAALNFCANLQRMGDQAMLVSAVASDERGTLALERMEQLGLSTRYVGVVGEPPTGIAIVSTSESGEPSYRIPRPAAFDMVSLELVSFEQEALDGEELKQVDWLYFGTLLQIEARVEQFTTRVARSRAGLRCFYDMNLRTGHWNLGLVQRLSGLASIVKLNEDEAKTLFELTRTEGLTAVQRGGHDAAQAEAETQTGTETETQPGTQFGTLTKVQVESRTEVQAASAQFSLKEFCRMWAAQYGIDVICVTRGPDGCAVWDGTGMHEAAGFPIKVSDTVGAGDAFAAAFLHGYGRGWPIERTAQFANALGAIVASRAGATPDWSLEECLQLAGFSPE